MDYNLWFPDSKLVKRETDFSFKSDTRCQNGLSYGPQLLSSITVLVLNVRFFVNNSFAGMRFISRPWVPRLQGILQSLSWTLFTIPFPILTLSSANAFIQSSSHLPLKSTITISSRLCLTGTGNVIYDFPLSQSLQNSDSHNPNRRQRKHAFPSTPSQRNSFMFKAGVLCRIALNCTYMDAPARPFRQFFRTWLPRSARCNSDWEKMIKISKK